jgi:hypothetical protein
VSKYVPLKLALIVPLCMVLMLAFAGLILPNFVARTTENLVSESCLICNLHIGAVRWSLFAPRQIEFEQLHFTNGEIDSLQLDLVLPSLKAELELWPLLKNKLVIRHLLAVGPQLKVLYAGKPPLTNVFTLKRNLQSLFSVDEAQVQDGQAQVQIKTHGALSSLSLKSVTLQASPFGTLASVQDLPVQLRFAGQLEQSGNLNVTLTSDGFFKPYRFISNVELSDQNLQELNPLLHSLYGFELHGTVIRSRTHLEMRDNHLHVQVLADYRDFSWSPINGSKPEAVMLLSSALDHKRSPASQTLVVQRRPDELLSSLILRGWVDAVALGAPYQ